MGFRLLIGFLIASYNLENYGPADRRTPAGFERAYPKPESEKAAVRRAIEAIKPDVLALQEMGSAGHLEELQRDLRSEGADYAYSALMEGQDRQRRTAVLSKFRLKWVRPHNELKFRYLGEATPVKRGLLEVAVDSPAGEIAVLVVHLKSHLTERPSDPEGVGRRQAEAAAVRDCILRDFPYPERARWVMLGDCNDGSHSAALHRLERKGSRVVAIRLPAADGRGETWTEAWPARDLYCQLDHILVSPGLFPYIVSGTAHIYDGQEGSDHRMIWTEVGRDCQARRLDAARPAVAPYLTTTGTVTSAP